MIFYNIYIYEYTKMHQRSFEVFQISENAESLKDHI